MGEKGEKKLVDVLNAISDYISNNNKRYISSELIYCSTCEVITRSEGSYSRFAGRDCGGDHYETVKQTPHCPSCNTEKYKPISSKDITSLENLPEEKIIHAIENSLSKLHSPTLYNKQLSEIADQWNALPKKQKIRQIISLKSKGQRVASARKELGQLEKSIGAD